VYQSCSKSWREVRAGWDYLRLAFAIVGGVAKSLDWFTQAQLADYSPL
jgi:hypothetical protein